MDSIFPCWRVLSVLLLVMPLTTSPAHANGSRYFPETGFVVDSPMLAAFERYGGVSLIGLPISDAMETSCESQSCLVQWFERSRIEIHHDDGQAYRGRIAADFLAARGTPWQFGTESSTVGCRLFTETGYAACGSFLDAWQRYGGIERLGSPISSPQDETYIDDGTGESVTYRTQWFERAALEDHGTQGIMLRLLGSQTYPSWAEHLLADRINAERASAGLPALTWRDDLAEVARAHSVDSAQHNVHSHTGSDGRGPRERADALHLPGYCGGEVISYQQSPVAAIEALMRSPAHHDIILDPHATHFGVGYGVVLGQVRGGYWPATVWTVDFCALH
jgi:uncharacterized protein YkwD